MWEGGGGGAACMGLLHGMRVMVVYDKVMAEVVIVWGGLSCMEEEVMTAGCGRVWNVVLVVME